MAENPNPPPGWPTGRGRGRPGAQAVDLEIARRIRRRRLELGLPLRELAEAVGVSYQQMYKYETGANRISAGRLHRIAQALGVEVGHLFADVGPMGHDWAGADKGQRRRLLELVRHVAAIPDPRQRQALCRLARELAALGVDGSSSSAPRTDGGPRHGPGSAPP